MYPSVNEAAIGSENVVSFACRQVPYGHSDPYEKTFGEILIETQISSYRWLTSKLWYFQNNCVGDTIVNHWASYILNNLQIFVWPQCFNEWK